MDTYYNGFSKNKLRNFFSHQIMTIEIKETIDIKQEEIIALYKANKWSSAEKPEILFTSRWNLLAGLI